MNHIDDKALQQLYHRLLYTMPLVKKRHIWCPVVYREIWRRAKEKPSWIYTHESYY